MGLKWSVVEICFLCLVGSMKTLTEDNFYVASPTYRGRELEKEEGIGLIL